MARTAKRVSLGGMETKRLFVGIALPEVVRAELDALVEPIDGVRWIPRENLHLTLRFIGDTELEKQNRIAEALGRVHVHSFILPTEGVGVFPTRGIGTVLWAGLGKAHPHLFQLRQRVDDALLTVDMDLDVRSFHPHITLARLERGLDPKKLERYLHLHRDFEGALFRVDAFHLFSSDLSPVGPPVYRIVQSFALE